MRTSKRLVNVGVVGVGSMGQNHARVLANVQGAVLVGVSDPDAARAGMIADRFDTRAFPDLAQLLPEVEAVVVAAPTVLHHDLVEQCLGAGVHVLVEKPIAVLPAEGDRLHELATRRGLVLQVGHVERFNPVFPELAGVLSHERPFAFAALRLSPHTTRAADVSVVLDLMVHDLDLVLALVDAPLSHVSASGCRAKSQKLDHAVALLHFQNGVVATLTASKVGQHKVRELTASCDNAFVSADFLQRSVRIMRSSTSSYEANRGLLSYKQEGLVENVLVPVLEPLQAELIDFLECVREGRRPRVDAQVGSRVLRLALEIEALAEQHARGPA